MFKYATPPLNYSNLLIVILSIQTCACFTLLYFIAAKRVMGRLMAFLVTKDPALGTATVARPASILYIV